MSFRVLRPGERIEPGDWIMARQFHATMWKGRVTRVTAKYAYVPARVNEKPEIKFRREINGWGTADRVPAPKWETVIHRVFRKTEASNG